MGQYRDQRAECTSCYTCHYDVRCKADKKENIIDALRDDTA